VLDKPLTVPAALKATDPGGWPTAVVAVDLESMLEARAEQGSGEDYPIVRAVVNDESLTPVRTSYEVVGHRSGGELLLKASFELREALAVSHSEEELDEMETQPA